MTVEDNVSFFGWASLFTDGLMAAQLGLFMVSLLVFAASLALCVMAMRAAASIRRSNLEARNIPAFAERHAQEMRDLGERIELARGDVADRHAAIADVEQRYLASLRAPEAAGEPAPGPAAAPSEPAETAPQGRLDEAEPAEEPPARSGSLFRLMRRR